MTRTKRKLKRKTPLIICCVLLLLLVCVAGGMILVENPEFVPEGITIPGIENKRLNVLLMGIDARQGETMARTDSMILASYDPKTKQVSLLSIPRDTRVAIPGHGMDKINSASVYGGPELSMKVVSSLLGVQVKYYVIANFSGFKDIVDTLGGVTLDVDQDMYHEDEEEDLGINLKKGVQRLNGDKALQYVRYRDYELGDIDRTKQQQKFLMALGKEMLQPSTIPKLPKLVTEINKYVKTNMGASDMVKMASAMKNSENYNMVAQTLPGRPIEIDGGSYWGVDPTEAKQAVAQLFRGEIVTDVVLNTPLSGQYAVPETTTPSTSEQVTEETPTDKQQQAGSKTQPGQTGTKTTTTKPGQTTGSGTSGASGAGGAAVIITPIEPGGTSSTGTTTGKTPTGSKTTSPDTETDKTGASSSSSTTT